MSTMPKGKYYLADPCYIMEDEQYSRCLQETNYFNLEYRGGICTDSETKLKYVVFSTAFGDGVYQDNKNRDYPVDAGCIACIPVEMVEKPKYPELVFLETFEEDLEVSYQEEGGVIHFGDVEISTDPPYEEYDDEEDEELNIFTEFNEEDEEDD